MPQIKLDITTLPDHERKVKFQIVGMDSRDWIEGIYLADEELFFVGFEDSGEVIDAFRVDEWEYL
jgi:hypothetical protein